MKLKLNSILVLLLLVSSSIYAGEQEWGRKDHETGTSVSFYELLANGEKYNGWRVFTSAVLSYDGKVTLLFPSCERYLIYDTSSTIAVDIAELESLGVSADTLAKDSRKDSVRYVFVEGVYSYMERERTSAATFTYTIGPKYVGVLDDINYLAIDSSGIECSKLSRTKKRLPKRR